ncbi:MAG: hypothetical protein ACI9IP_002781 [Arcticibacterium sp.]|jgi:hypothetical protein
MSRRYVIISFFLTLLLSFLPILGFGQQVKNVPEAFKAMTSAPEVISLKNDLSVPNIGWHLKGVQVIEKNGTDKLLISGS